MQIILTANKQLCSGTLYTGLVDRPADVLVRVFTKHIDYSQEVFVSLAPDAVARTVRYLARSCGCERDSCTVR